MAALAAAPGRTTMFEDPSAAHGAVIRADRGLYKELERLPDGLDIIIAYRSSFREGTDRIAFAAAVDPDGELAFVGECADGFFRVPLADYVAHARPDDAMRDVLVDVVTHESEWAAFNAFDLGEG